MLLAEVLYHEKKYQQALEEIQKGFVPETLERAYRIRGAIYLELQNYTQAIADLTLAVKIKKQDSLAYRYRGDAYFNLKKYPEALEDYQKVIEITPESTRTYWAIAKIYEFEGEKGKMRQAYETQGDVLFEKQRYTQAVGAWRKAAKIAAKKSPERKKLRAKIRKAQELKK